ncbi:SCP-like protein [Ancylostoma ceylanicum]|uniref:SCP-like protein n=1 Tax=Ancylostoma ceylanicum TaxID=53326 RepID=A0A0D6LKY0_9BILA|nr:SCP-like protein [Ancylostoma ceylanicum]
MQYKSTPRKLEQQIQMFLSKLLLLAAAAVVLASGTAPASSKPNTMCPQNTGGEHDKIRIRVLDAHNTRRSQLAFGKVKRKDGTFYPKAGGLVKMVYNCTLEAMAREHVKKCVVSNTGEAPENGNEENIAAVDFADAASRVEAVTEMAWEYTEQLGCAVQKCNNSFFVMCQYRFGYAFSNAPQSSSNERPNGLGIH